jgi:2-methylisocitrate lyase-like PEP mutase family enzyme
MPTIAEKRRTFREMHASGCFVIPNPYDVGGARLLQALGFKALATTSAGAAFADGMPDGKLSREATLANIAEIVAATDVPVNADFGNCFGATTADVGESVKLCVATGVAGLSIEDATGNEDKPLYELGEAVERVKAARAAIDAAGGDVILVGRAECFLVGSPDPLRDSLRRIEAYAEAGADCLYVPGLRQREDIAAIVKAVAPKPVNVLVGGAIGLTVADLAALGVRRVSVGGALSRAAWGAFMRAAREIAEKGSFQTFGEAISFAEVNGFFKEDLKRRPDR